MKRRIRWAVVPGLVLTFALLSATGCTKVITTPSAAPVNTVTSSGAGQVSATPDQAEMSFGVTRQDANAKAALAEVSTVAKQITAALKKAGVAGKDIQTANVSVYPTYGPGQKPTITGYQASISVNATVRDITTLGDVISAAVDAGADTIGGPTFTISEDSKYRAMAIDKAVADAGATAQTLARSAGRSLGKVVSISEANVTVPPSPMLDTAARAEASVPISAGELDVSSSVTVVFELK